jgi:hypothetical protein
MNSAFKITKLKVVVSISVLVIWTLFLYTYIIDCGEYSGPITSPEESKRYTQIVGWNKYSFFHHCPSPYHWLKVTPSDLLREYGVLILPSVLSYIVVSLIIRKR